MRKVIITILLVTLLPLAAASARDKKEKLVYRWVDAAGVTHYGDSVPAEYAELEKQVINTDGVTVEILHGKRTEAEIAEAIRQREVDREIAIQKKSDAALLSTYMTIDEIVMHRDRRIELFQAQSKVTEFMLQNIKRRLDDLMVVGSKYRPYSIDPDAQMIDQNLAADINDTRDTIERYEANLDRFQSDEELIATRFDGDITRFKALKGLD